MRTRNFLTAMIAALSLSQMCLADNSPFKDEWIVRIEAQKLERQFMYRGSSLDKVAKLTVHYYKEDNPDNKTLYEMLWFNDGKPIGLERENELNIPEGKAAKFQVKLKKDTSPEVEKALADAIIRLSLDAYRKRFAAISFRVPQESYDGIVSQLNKLNCVESDTEVEETDKALMSFSIETVKGGPSTILYYY